MYNFQNPYIAQYQTQQVVKVNGENGARAYQMGANSSVLLLDETQPVVWLKTTDGAGYPTVTGYNIAPMQTKEELVASLEARVARLEGLFDEPNSSGS